MIKARTVALCLWVALGLPTAVFADANTLGCEQNKLAQPSTRPPLTDAELYKLAQQVTVKVQAASISGSGAIFDRTVSHDGNHQGNRYRILTNAHNLLTAESAQIQTNDGQLHAAMRTNSQALGNSDLAVLEFTSKNTYRVAEWSRQTISRGTQVVAAGFEFDRPEITTVNGEVSHFLAKPLRRGYQLGYVVSHVRQGMSGGPILDRTGLLLGINAISAYPLLNRVYVFADGSRPNLPTIKQMRRSNWGIPVSPYLECLD
jgi:serine protease Do